TYSTYNGTVSSDPWNQWINAILPEGLYRVNFIVQYAPDVTKDFQIVLSSYDKELITGAPGEITKMRFYGEGYSGYWKGLDYGTVDSFGVETTQSQTWLTSSSWDLKFEENLPAGNYFYRIAIQAFDQDWNLIDEVIDTKYYFTIGSTGQQVSVAEPEPVWVRTMPMTCWQIFINEDNMFEFIFWYPYKDNNWVQIFDMEGNMVYEVDVPLDDPHIIVDLPDGMYNVKTFRFDPDSPIQEFIIGKP
ncbi:MAG: hypothetical protein MUO60_15165, partial [Clostridiaceae bacterium]|nr:hypothetical protein [Clostridiaceae bacterium]